MNSICLVSLVVGAVVAPLLSRAASSIEPPISAGARIIEVGGSAACASPSPRRPDAANARQNLTQCECV
ncbi:MAG: hypothetical protein ACI4RA_02885 [Kiritimatiellia bacterium]